MFGTREISYRQLTLFCLIVGIGLSGTFFSVREVYLDAVNDSRNTFRAASSRFLTHISADIADINASVNRFADVFTLTGEPEGRALADFVDSYTSINPSSFVTTLLVIAADDPATRQRVASLIGELNPAIEELSLDPSTDSSVTENYYLAYIGVREKDRSVDGGKSLIGHDLAYHDDYRALLDKVLSVGQTDFTLTDDRLSAAATESGRLVIANPFMSSVGPAYLVEVLHLDQVAHDGVAGARFISEVVFENVRPSARNQPEGQRYAAIPVGRSPSRTSVPADGEWEDSRSLNVGLGGLTMSARASAVAYEVDYDAVLRSALIGLFVTSIIGYLAYDQIRRSNRVVEIVKRRTRALKEAHSELENHYKLLQNLNSDVDEARKAAEAANLAKSEFLATISHELRTPLNAILGFSEILETQTLGPIGDSRYADYAHDINTSGKHLLSIINDILDLAKLEAGRIDIEKKPFQPRYLVQGVVNLLEHQAEEKELKFGFDISEELPEEIQGDELRLRQVLINLASNAIKFTKHGSVTIRMHVKAFKNGAAGWILEVQDTGIGIPEDKQAVLFDRFTQLDTTHSRRHGGVGLGLAICRELVDRMDGMISVRSIQNVGTTIRVQLPLDEASGDEDDGALI